MAAERDVEWSDEDRRAQNPDAADVGDASVPPVEQSIEGADPDLLADADLEEGRPADPDVDAAESLRQEGGA
jgi:hypothetical protein